MLNSCPLLLTFHYTFFSRSHSYFSPVFLSFCLFFSFDMWIITHINTLTLLIFSSSLFSSRLHASTLSPACDLFPLFHSSSFPLSHHYHICHLVNQGLLGVLNILSSSWPPKKPINTLSSCFPILFFLSYFLAVSFT